MLLSIMDDETQTSVSMGAGRFLRRSYVLHAAAYVVVAAAFFSVGVGVASNGSLAAAVAQVPIIGSGLNPSPVTNADLSNFWEAWHALQDNYVITHASSTMPSVQDRIYGAIQGLAASYGDPYTVFFPPTQAKAFSDNISGSFAGVGMEIDVKNNVLTVVAPLKGSPAEKAGIKTGDQIEAINGKSTQGMSLDAAVNAIRGAVGSTVDLSVVRNGMPQTIKVTRETIQVPETNDGYEAKTGVYHIALYEFTSNSAQLFDEAFNRFKASGSHKLVIDLRGNPGGYLDAAVQIASHFLPKGETIVTEDYGGKRPKQVYTSLGYDDVPKGTKIVVLVDGGSASAAEILSGALKDHHVATLIGEKTFGKGSVQTLIPIGGGELKVTIARWLTPNGTWIMGNGIQPDITVPYTQADAKAGTDPQMARAVQFLTTGK